jgi:hypothetical protein
MLNAVGITSRSNPAAVTMAKTVRMVLFAELAIAAVRRASMSCVSERTGEISGFSRLSASARSVVVAHRCLPGFMDGRSQGGADAVGNNAAMAIPWRGRRIPVARDKRFPMLSAKSAAFA